MHFSDKEEIDGFDSLDADMGKKIVEVTETEYFDADGNLTERTKVTTTTTETDTTVWPTTPYAPYTVTWDTTETPVIMN